ncbi:MAG: bifunctional chorismate mutase/prephenate dehydrogenase [candidate division WOR-3 bacterium]
MEEIEKLRKEVKKVDREIIKLIGKRLSITKEIGKRKKEKGIPLRDWKVEKEVIKNALQAASKEKLSKDLVKAIMQHIITESKLQQEKLQSPSYTGDKEDILIIGGLGEMGRWFANFFTNQGHHVLIYDTKGKSKDFKCFDNLEDAINKATCILIATPFEVMPEIIEKIIKLNFKGIVFDIASLKSPLKSAIKKAIKHKIAYTSIHPMFGPKVSTLSDRIICICNCGNNFADEKVKKFFKDTSVSIIETSLEEHDKKISYILGLSHVINIIFMKALMNGEYKYEELKEMASTTFNSQLKTTKDVITENPYLYYAIQKFNPFKNKLYKNLESALRYVIKSVKDGKKKNFINVMEEGKKWLQEEQN